MNWVELNDCGQFELTMLSKSLLLLLLLLLIIIRFNFVKNQHVNYKNKITLIYLVKRFKVNYSQLSPAQPGVSACKMWTLGAPSL